MGVRAGTPVGGGGGLGVGQPEGLQCPKPRSARTYDIGVRSVHFLTRMFLRFCQNQVRSSDRT